MLKQNTVSSLPAKDNRAFFAKKNRQKQDAAAARLYEANAAAYQSRKAERRQLARTLSPIDLIEAHGLVVKPRGRSFRVFEPGNMRRELARIALSTKIQCWVACGYQNEQIGDNINLLKHLFGYDYLEAIDALLRHAGIFGGSSPALPAIKALRSAAIVQYATEPVPLPVMPQQTGADIAAGRDYLQRRGIDLTVILKAERDGAVRYGNFSINERMNQSVLFIGMDDAGDAMAITHRSVRTHFRGDIAGSDKAFPCILWGALDDIVLVEGGISGLAVQTRAKRAGEPVPTVIVTGGSGVLKFLNNNVVRNLVAEPIVKRITVWFENEKLTPDAIAKDAPNRDEASCLALLAKKQAESDAAHERQIGGIESMNGPVPVTRCRPVADRHSDVADVLIAEVTGAAAGNIAEFVDVIAAAQKRDLPPGSRLTTLIHTLNPRNQNG